MRKDCYENEGNRHEGRHHGIAGAIETLWQERVLAAIVVATMGLTGLWIDVRIGRTQQADTNARMADANERLAVLEFAVLSKLPAQDIAAIRAAVRREFTN